MTAPPPDLLLIRLATVYLDRLEDDWRQFGMRFEDIELSTLGAWDVDNQVRLLLAAAKRLPYRPKVTSDGAVIVPERERREAEEAIEHTANLIALANGGRRRISSPTPAVALFADGDEGRAWLDGVSYLELSPNGEGSPLPSWTIELTEEIQKGLSDRLDGAALLAEALAHEHPTGQFHEYIRLFERAFARPARHLAQPLASVLHPQFGYTEDEIEHWLGVLRDPATHADARPGFVLEADVRPVIGRMRQAAFDLLFNKTSWRNPDHERRELWKAPTGTSGVGNDIFATKGVALAMTFHLTDSFGSYPMDLSAHADLPDGWWAPTPPSNVPVSAEPRESPSEQERS
jgi:hypothetical protein